MEYSIYFIDIWMMFFTNPDIRISMRYFRVSQQVYLPKLAFGSYNDILIRFLGTAVTLCTSELTRKLSFYLNLETGNITAWTMMFGQDRKKFRIC